MHRALFLQSEVSDPYAIYQTMRNEDPVYWDEKNNLWAIYSYKDCVSVLQNVEAHIPPVDKNGLNEYALRITDQLARLSNSNQHAVARDAATLLADKMMPVSIENTMTALVATREIDWVEAVCKKLPVVSILKGFGFSDGDTAMIVAKTDQLIKILLPSKTAEQIKIINKFSTDACIIVEKHLLHSGLCNDAIDQLTEKYSINQKMAIEFFVSNLVGLVIQSYDAGRGILSNALLQLLSRKNLIPHRSISKDFIKKIIIETLRFDAPVQSTRRIATSTILINNAKIKKGDTILLLLAAANRDPEHFIHADLFDPERTNNNEHITFGIGNHMCIAKHFSAALAANAFVWLFTHFKNITLLEKEIIYEPLINVRLPKKLTVVAQS